MLYQTLPLALLAMAAASPTGLSSRQEWDGERPDPAIECDGLLFPNYPTCRQLIEQHWGGDGTICTGSITCKVYTGSGNCRLSWCNNEDYEVCRPLSETKQRALAIADACEPQNSGGFQSDGEPAPWTEVAMRATLAALRAMDPNSRIAVAKEPIMKIISVEENEREVKVIEDAAAALRIDPLNKRQQDGDNNFVVTKRSSNIERPGARFPVSGSVPSGSWTLQETESTTSGVTTSFELGGAWEVFSASAGVSVSSSHTVQSAVGITINVDCPGQGVVLWAPLHDYYEGYFEPSGESAWAYVPLDQSATLDSYFVRCLG